MSKKKLASHPYTEIGAFQRLMLLIATLIRHPGIGGADPNWRSSEQHHNALTEVRDRLISMGEQENIDGLACSLPTLRKDLGILKRWRILDSRMYRWGYFLGTGVMTEAELQTALNALHSQAKYQRDPQVSQIYHTVSRRLYGAGAQDDALYPVRTQLDRVIIQTDPEEMMLRGQYRNTLFHQLPQIESAILQGQALELYHRNHPYSSSKPRYIKVYPLQLIYSDIAWYLLHQDCQTEHLACVRLDRLSEYCQPLSDLVRGLDAQRQNLRQAHRLLETGWGVYLGNQEEQKLELRGELPLVSVSVRFFAPVIEFILEGECRHPSQTISTGKNDPLTGKTSFVDYTVKLPLRSHKAFMQWVNRFMSSAMFLEPMELVKAHRQSANALSRRYCDYYET
jgi:predicted DNA-binding transcriptional regulator YafY